LQKQSEFLFFITILSVNNKTIKGQHLDNEIYNGRGRQTWDKLVKCESNEKTKNDLLHDRLRERYSDHKNSSLPT